jgi:hypothetical protein
VSGVLKIGAVSFTSESGVEDSCEFSHWAGLVVVVVVVVVV